MSDRRASSARRSARARSQHFLRSRSLAAELVRAAGVRRDDVVVDLGAGRGRLTAELARAAGEVVAVELDPSLVRALRARSWQNVLVVHGDAAAVRLPSAPFRVVANLPFAGTNAILRHLLDDSKVPLVQADLIVEWGVAVKRALPWPSTASGVIWGARYRFAVDRRLPAAAFAPEPSVDAGVLVIERRARPLVPERLLDRYAQFVAKGFRHGARAVVPRGTPVQARHLDAHQWAELFMQRVLD